MIKKSTNDLFVNEFPLCLARLTRGGGFDSRRGLFIRLAIDYFLHEHLNAERDGEQRKKKRKPTRCSPSYF